MLRKATSFFLILLGASLSADPASERSFYAQTETPKDPSLTLCKIIYLEKSESRAPFFCESEMLPLCSEETIYAPRKRRFTLSQHFDNLPPIALSSDVCENGGYFWILLPVKEESRPPYFQPITLTLMPLFSPTLIDAFYEENLLTTALAFSLNSEPLFAPEKTYTHPIWDDLMRFSQESDPAFEAMPIFHKSDVNPAFEQTAPLNPPAIKWHFPLNEAEESLEFQMEHSEPVSLSAQPLPAFSPLSYHTPFKCTLSWSVDSFEIIYEKEASARKVSACSEALGQKIGLALLARKPFVPDTDLSHFDIEAAALPLPFNAPSFESVKTVFKRIVSLEKALASVVVRPDAVVFEKTLAERFAAPAFELPAFALQLKALCIDPLFTNAAPLMSNSAIDQPSMAKLKTLDPQGVSLAFTTSLTIETVDIDLPQVHFERTLSPYQRVCHEKKTYQAKKESKSLNHDLAYTDCSTLDTHCSAPTLLREKKLRIKIPQKLALEKTPACSIFALALDVHTEQIVNDLFASEILPAKWQAVRDPGKQTLAVLNTDSEISTPSTFALEVEGDVSVPLALVQKKYKMTALLLSPEGLCHLYPNDVVFDALASENRFFAEDEIEPLFEENSYACAKAPESKGEEIHFSYEGDNLASAAINAEEPYLREGPPLKRHLEASLFWGETPPSDLVESSKPYRTSLVSHLKNPEEHFNTSFRTVAFADLKHSLGQILLTLPKSAWRDVLPVKIETKDKTTHEVHYKLNRYHRDCATVYSDVPSLEKLRTSSMQNPFKPLVQYTPKSKRGGYYFSVDLKLDENHGFRREKQATIFVIDRSSSVEKQRFEVFKRAVSKSLPYLKRGDYFNIIVYDNKAKKLSEVNLPVSENNLRRARRFLDDEQHAALFKSFDIYDLIEKLGQEAKDERHLSHIVLLTEPKPLKNLRKKRREMRKVIKNNNRDYSLFIATACQREGQPMADLLTAFNGGHALFSPTNAAFPRKFSALIRQISQPVLRDLHVVALRRKTGEMIKLYPSSPKGESHLYALKTTTIHGEVDDLEDLELFLQGRVGKRFINLSQDISFDKAIRAGRSMRRAIAKKEALIYYQSYLDDGEIVHLERAAKLLNPHSVSLPHKWD